MGLIFIAFEMAETIAKAPVPSSTDSTDSVGPQVAILFVGVALCLGVISRQLLKGTRVPYTVALLLLGVGIGGLEIESLLRLMSGRGRNDLNRQYALLGVDSLTAFSASLLEYGTDRGLGVLGDSIRMWANINPNLILFLFLPALLFESSFAMDFHQIKRCLVQMLLLAGPGVLISTFFLGLVIHGLFPYEWNWSTVLLLGGLLSATDPVAVVALLKELGASKKLSTLIEGESLMNDGTAIVVFHLFLNMALGQHFNAGNVISFLSRVTLGALALGLLFGIVTVFWVGVVFNDTIIEITLTLTASYMAFFVAEEDAGISGVLTVMTVGMFFAAFARTAFTGESEESMHHFWEMISYIANTLIFFLSGVVIVESILRSHDKIEGRDWGYLLLLYVFVQLSRAVVVGVLYPGLNYFGYGTNWKEATILIWAGLRGAVALSLSLSVSQSGVDTPSASSISKLTGARFVFLTGGVVFLTLIINGSTTQFLLHYLKMDSVTETKLRILEFAKYEMYSKALEAFGELGEDEELGPADWTTVRKYVSCLSDLSEDDRPTHPHEPPASDVTEDELLNQQLQDIRLRFLNGLQAVYWSMLEEGRITQTAALILMQSVDEALDKVARQDVLLDWEGLRPHVRFPNYLKYLQWRSSSLFPQKASTYLLVERLELACYVSAAFLRAHRMTRHHLRGFIGESEVTETIIRESEVQEEEGRRFLEDVRLSFPQVLRVVKTKQVTFAILKHLSEYVKSLGDVGLLEYKETLHLHDAVQVDLKKLLRNPPLVKMPAAEETLKNQPLIGALPATVQEPLLGTAKEFMKLRDSVIYKEDLKPDGIWLIANGVVKWSNKATSGQRLRHPTFSYGSTLGLYEALTGKPFLCDIVADSVVHCFFIERSKILSIPLRDPELEDFLWQESALAVAKIVLAPQFDTATLQEMRALFMEGSTMRTFLRGEVFELRHNEVGVLLEGFVKQEGSIEVIAAPAGLIRKTPLPSPADSRSSITSHPSTCFHTEARSRILLVNMGLSAHILSRGSAQLLPLPHRYSRPSLRQERDSLLQWPSKPSSRVSSEPQIKGEKPRSDGEIAPAHRGSVPVVQAWGSGTSVPDKYIAKALEISLFGSKVEGMSKSWRASSEERPEVGQSRLSQSHSNLVKRMSLVMQDGMDDEKSRRRIASHGSLGLSLPFVPLPHLRVNLRSGDSSDDSDKEEHIVKIDSPSTLFHNTRSDF